MREISLSGGEITILKTIGLSGTHVTGKQLLEHMEDMEAAEFLDELSGLMSMGYVLANKVNIRTIETVETASFHINPSYARDLREAIHPSRQRKPQTGRRQRRG